jgi:hypothetical protein
MCSKLTPPLISISKKWLFCLFLLAVTPQPAGNANQALNLKQAFLLLVIEYEVVGLASLLLKNKKIFF